MDIFLSRYRNLSILVLAIAAQLILLAYQVKSRQDVRLIRVWAVTAVTPLARLIEGLRGSSVGFVRDYFVLVDTREENRKLKDDLGRLKMEVQFLRNELSTADRAGALAVFQSRAPSRTIAARIIGSGTGANSQAVFVDRGSTAGVMRSMAVVTPDGIVGKVLAVYPTASQVMLITDPSFAAGVVSQKNKVHGTLKGQGRSTCQVDYVQNEEKVEPGEMFYTSGDDRIFPKGFPVGEARVVRAGRSFQEIFVTPSGLQGGLEEVLIVLEGVHQPVPEAGSASSAMHVQSAPPVEPGQGPERTLSDSQATDADRMRDRYKRVGEAQGHAFGHGLPGSRPPNFNLNPDAPKPKPAAGGAAPNAQVPDVTKPKPDTGAPTPPAPAPAKPSTSQPQSAPTDAPKPPVSPPANPPPVTPPPR